jgi:acyl dehydratase
MPIDIEHALAARFPSVTTSWDADRVLLYHLGIGAAADGIDDRSLRLVWEDALEVLPTFAVVPGSDAAAHTAAYAPFAADPSRLLQRAHHVRIDRPLPTSAVVTSEARIEQVRDTGRSAVLTVVADTRDESGTHLATNRFVLLVRGAGGFGGDPPSEPSAGDDPPEQARVFTCSTAPNQTALYRLSGDRSALHIDPGTARAAGFIAPPLAGLCTLGIIGRRVIETELVGPSTRVIGVGGTFAGAVYPGETLVVHAWPANDALHFVARVAERNVVAVRDGRVDLG